MTDPDFHQRASRLFLEACEADIQERDAILSREVDPELLHHVQALLQRDREPSNFLDSPVLGDDFHIPTVPVAAHRDSPPPETIGRYRVLGLLGRGGMGVVYLAEQDSPRRQVALKVIDAGLASPEALRRFSFEAEVLARLQHPGIAQIHESGTDTAGSRTRVFFAMELVRGQSLGLHVAGGQLTVRERLELIATICDAVQHAHSKGVVHRDLKPANILVDEGGRPHVLDFGIARTVGADAGERTMHTLAGQVVGTMPYMAPEQVASDTRDVDTRVDVYALGVIMYEVLVGHPPLDVTGKALVQAARIIAEQEPIPLGTVDRALRGDIEAIAARALAKEPSRRYQTAADLAADIRRFLAGDPVAARPASAVYQFRKFARRNRMLVTLACLTAIVTVGAAGAISAVIAREGASRSNAAASEALWTGVLDEADVWEVGDHEALTRMLDRFANELQKQNLDLPTEAAVRTKLGKAYRKMGGSYSAVSNAEKAVEQLRLALGLLEERLGSRDPLTMMAMDELGLALAELAFSMGGIAPEIEPLRAERRAESVSLIHSAMAASRARLGAADPLTLRLAQDLCSVYVDFGEYILAEPLAKDLVVRCIQTWGRDDSRTLEAEMSLAHILALTGRLDEGLSTLRRVAETRRNVQGPQDQTTHTALLVLGRCLQDAGRLEEALNPLREALEISTFRLGPDNRVRLSEAHQYAALLRAVGRYEQALALFQDIVARRSRVLPPNHGHTLRSRCQLARTLLDLHRYSEAEAEGRSLVVDAQAGLEKGHPDIGDFRAVWAMALGAMGQADRAEAEFRRAFDEVRGASGEFAHIPQRVVDQAITFLRNIGRDDAADEFDAMLPSP